MAMSNEVNREIEKEKELQEIASSIANKNYFVKNQGLVYSLKGGVFGLIAFFIYATITGKSKFTYSVLGATAGGVGGFLLDKVLTKK